MIQKKKSPSQAYKLEIKHGEGGGRHGFYIGKQKWETKSLEDKIQKTRAASKGAGLQERYNPLSPPNQEPSPDVCGEVAEVVGTGAGASAMITLRVT